MRNTRLRGDAIVLGNLSPLQPDQREPVFGVPRTDRKLGCDRKRRIACRLRIIESEIIDHLLDSNRAGRRHFACVEEPPHVGVRGCVDVDRERRERICRDSSKWILVEVIVPFGMKVRVIPAGKIRRWCGRRRCAATVHTSLRAAIAACHASGNAANHAAYDSHFLRLGSSRLSIAVGLNGNRFRHRLDAHRDLETFDSCGDAHVHHRRLESSQFESELVPAATQLSKRELAARIGCCRALFRPSERHSNAGQHASGDISHNALNFAGLDCAYTNAMRRDVTRIETAMRVRMSVPPLAGMAVASAKLVPSAMLAIA